MTTINKQIDSSSTECGLSEQQIADFLTANPNFFQRRSDILLQLELPHHSGQAISLVERQVALLRERNIDMRARLAKLLDIAKDNDKLLDKTQRLVLSLLEAESLDDLAVAINEGLLYEFKADACSFMLFNDENDYPESNIKTLPIKDAEQEISGLLKLGKPICGVLREPELAYLFPETSNPVKSAAILPLGRNKPIGILGVGSFEADHFEAGMGTLFLTYLGEVLLRLLPRYSNKS